MRDLVITFLILGWLPKVIRQPWIGALLFVWVSVMTPQNFGYGLALSLPFAAIVTGATVLGLLVGREQVSYKMDAPMALLLLFPLWMCLTYAFAFEQEAGFDRWKIVMKIFLMLHIASSVLRTRRHLELLIGVLVFSVGVFGVKGGIFTLLTGGGAKVWGPPGQSFMTDNNAIAVALVMTIPLMGYLRSLTTKPWLRRAGIAAMGLSSMAVLGTQSRGALIAISAMLFFLWLKSSNKLPMLLVFVVLVPLGVGFMPASWTDRMHTIQSYDQDASALGRINAWTNAFHIANDRPLIGGGFELYSARVFAKYAPDPTDVHAAHSVYFQILGEHGYAGLLIYLSIMITVWRRANRIIRYGRDKPEFDWAVKMSTAIQVSIIGFSSGGAFVNIGYWELLYYELLIVIVAYRIVFPKPAMRV